MAILNPSRPGFKRTSENTKDGDRQAAAEMARYARIDAEAQKREDELEALACGVSCSSRSALTDSAARKIYDLEGVVY